MFVAVSVYLGEVDKRLGDDKLKRSQYAAGTYLLGVRGPAWVEHVRRAVVRDGGAEEQADGVDCEEYTAQHVLVRLVEIMMTVVTSSFELPRVDKCIDSTYVQVC